MKSLIVIRSVAGSVPYWVIDETIDKAKERFKRMTGKAISAKASIVEFSGTSDELESLGVNDLGDIRYHKNLVKKVIQ